MKRAGPSDQTVIWDGESVDDFLELSKRVGAHTIYLNESVVERGDGDEQDPQHLGETESVEAAFLLDGHFHLFTATASWVATEEAEEDDTPDETTRVQAALESNREEIVGEILTGIRAGAGPLALSNYSILTKVRGFLAMKYSAPSVRTHLITPDGDNDSLATLVEDLSDEISRRLLAEDRSRAEKYVDELVSWSRTLGIKSLSKGDVDAFLLEKGAPLGPEGERLLWTKAKLAVKTGR